MAGMTPGVNGEANLSSAGGDEVNHSYEVRPIGAVESELTDPASAPRQGYEGAPDAWLVFESDVLEGLDGLRPGDEVVVLTWLHRAHRDELRTHPCGDLSRPEQGVFSTCSPHRPNPIGLHPVEIVSIDGGRVRVRPLEAVDGTPIVDLKPLLGRDGSPIHREPSSDPPST
jgi:tRNA-Thr(GGU) m(6)t(6)A37 methyltransferase TsaA